jgi:hypothetical protein
MRRFHKNPEVVCHPTDLAARILREIAMASEAGFAEIRLLFRQDWKPSKYGGERGLGVHIECGRADSFLLETKYGDTFSFANDLPTVFDSLAKLMARAWDPSGEVARQLRALLNEDADDS